MPENIVFLHTTNVAKAVYSHIKFFTKSSKEQRKKLTTSHLREGQHSMRKTLANAELESVLNLGSSPTLCLLELLSIFYTPSIPII